MGATEEVPLDVNTLFERVNNFVSVRDRMTLSNFLNPEDENEVPHEPKTADDVLHAVISDWQVENGKKKAAEEEEDDRNVPLPLTLTSKEVVKYMGDILD
ncbi:hypothetical protein QBC32DRAFT_328306 [Pseudoneurospora amorphoporcata]|uniref:Uncharacterized protein n=1 Tax=Pseudoneurospora amorphoporcata TaxID=241081 RepID=A0AAN6SBQ8_9PEZI|nr:hypothetical protein QBC32DRAFT_328306 [Pseudoneurospora amorphoporcata]